MARRKRDPPQNSELPEALRKIHVVLETKKTRDPVNERILKSNLRLAQKNNRKLEQTLAAMAERAFLPVDTTEASPSSVSGTSNVSNVSTRSRVSTYDRNASIRTSNALSRQLGAVSSQINDLDSRIQTNNARVKTLKASANRQIIGARRQGNMALAAQVKRNAMSQIQVLNQNTVSMLNSKRNLQNKWKQTNEAYIRVAQQASSS